MTKSQTNLGWELVLDLDGQGSRPLHERVERALRSAIRSGRLGAGTALPPSRALAVDLACSRWTITEAYAQLTAEGYLEARTGSATRVRWSGPHQDPTPLPAPARPVAPRVDLTPGLPDLRAFPRRRWTEAIRSEAATVTFSELGFPAPGGHPRLRRMLGEYLERSRGVSRDGTQVLVSTSATSGVYRACQALLAAGLSAVGVEDPGWTRLHRVARAAGLATVPVPVDEHGIRVELLEQHPHVRAVIVTPAHQFPTGVVLSPDRRAQLLRWAAEVDGLVLEDDYDAEFRYDRAPVATLQGMDPSRVLLVGSLSKTLTPALGIGWTVTPTRWSTARHDEHLPGPQPPTLDQLAFAALLESGSYDRHLRACRRRYRTRRDALATALQTALSDCRISGVAAGLHLLLHLPPGVRTVDVVAQAASRDVHLTALRNYQASISSPGGPEALVLGYGNLLDGAVPEAATHLREVVHAAGAV